MCQVSIWPSDKDSASSAIYSSTVVQWIARLWAVMETREMEVIVFVIFFRLLPMGYGGWKEY
jgi:hypothetical protein